MSKILSITLLLLLSFASMSQPSIVGKWKTIDDETGEARSVVEIFEREGMIFGKIIKLYPLEGEDPDPVCDRCPENDRRYMKKIIGMEIIKDLAADGDEYTGGTVLKPDEGRIYKCKIWLDNNDLLIRGYWGFFYRTQRWVRYQ